jgi:hypothetical protein
MDIRGTVYVVHARRRDGGWIDFRTCDRLEATRVAARLAAGVTVDA